MKSIIPLLLVAVSVALFYLHIDPRYMEIKGLIEQKAEYERALQKVEELQVVRDELLTKYNALPKDDLAKLEKLIPANLNTVKFITDLASIGGPHGVSIRGINVKDAVADNSQEVSAGGGGKSYITTSISFSFTATYQNLKNFLKDVEKSLELVDVRSVKFDSSSDLSDLYNYSVTIQTYWVK
jgi:Tfp pilus assembly protein PilO